MDTSRERILKALCELVGRKDASVFQNADYFERNLQKIGSWQQLPEISALKTGLQERIPWELQKGASGPVSRALIASLATNISRKHQLPQELVLWAVESWAISLGLKIDAPVQKPAAAGNVSPAGSATAAPVLNVEPMRVIEKTRYGIVFGSDQQGVVKVFKSWWRPAGEAEISGLTAVAVKTEKPVVVLFAAAPSNRRKSQMPAKPPQAAVPVSTAAASDNTRPATKPAAAKPSQPSKPSQPAQPAVRQKPAQAVASPAAPLVLTGSAEELCAQARALLPGYGTRVDVPAAIQMLQQAAKLGSIPAQRMIGEIYHKGLGLKQDFATAAKWFRLAADAGDAHAQFYLGTLYQCGMGVEFNLGRAQEWLQKAAGQGHKEARTLLQEILQA